MMYSVIASQWSKQIYDCLFVNDCQRDVALVDIGMKKWVDPARCNKGRKTNERSEVGAFYWTVLVPDIVNPGREEQGSVSV
jgi:hypothetical protein